MVFELFEARAPRVAQRIAALAESGFYDGVAFHRVVGGFVIQGGDPGGTGAGGSDLGPFDDQFHVELQHNRGGVLSMAKGGDDSNDSQFFIAAGPARHLDYNHSVFGQLVTGEEVRAAIDAVATDGADRPLEPVVMENVEVLVDGENGVLVLSAPEGSTGTAVVTVAATDGNGVRVERTFQVQISPDTQNSPPFLADVAPIVTRVDTPVTVQLQAIDVEGDPAFYLDEQTLANNGLAVPVVSGPDLDYSVDFETGLLTITPRNGVTGVERITVATAVQAVAVDYQVLAVTIEP
jgi:cyclophilin family peptidyl-prolyl cis-trans isomerase